MVIDASVWIALFVEGDAHHIEASECLARALELQQTLHAPALVLAEVGGAIARKTGDRQAAEMAVQYLVSQPWIALHHGSEMISRGAARAAVACMLRGADASYVALAVHVSAPLITLDKEIVQRATSVARILTPREWLQQVAAQRE